MAKDRRVTKVRRMKPKLEEDKPLDVQFEVAGRGMVSVSMGIKASANFQTLSYDVGMTLPLPNEYAKTGPGSFQAVQNLVADFFSGSVRQQAAELTEAIVGAAEHLKEETSGLRGK